MDIIMLAAIGAVTGTTISRVKLYRKLKREDRKVQVLRNLVTESRVN